MAVATHRGRVTGTVTSGLLIGILVAWPAASFVTAHFGWRRLFGFDAVLLTALALAVTRRLPHRAVKGNAPYRRVSTNDIAEAANVSRPGLYLYFQSKEKVFNETIGYHAARLINEISAGMGGHGVVEEQLLHAFKIWTILSFDRNKNSPEAREIVDVTLVFAQAAHKEAYQKFEALLAAILYSGKRGPRLQAGRRGQ